MAPRVLRGTGRVRRKKIGYLGAEDFLLKNKSVIKIRNPNDKLCGPRAIVAAKAAVDYPAKHGTRVQLTKAHATTSDRPQLQAAYRLSKLAGVPEDCPVGPDELKKFQAVLPDYRIICVYVGRNSEAMAFTPYDEKKKDIVIIHHDDHYHGCNTLNGYYQSSYYCPYCLKPYDHKGHHRCQALDNKLCKCCRRRDCPDFATCHPQHIKATDLFQEWMQTLFGEKEKSCSKTPLCQASLLTKISPQSLQKFEGNLERRSGNQRN